MIGRIREFIEELLFPELRPFDRQERDRLMRNASKEPLSFLELAGILLGLIIVVAVTRYSVVELRPTDRIAYALVNFVVAIPLLAVTVGPFLLRRTRRGLRSQLH